MIFRLIYYALVAYVVYIVFRFFQNLGRALRPSAPSSAKPRLSGQMVKDEACGIYISKDEALREIIGGEERFFCSKECRKKFLADRKAAR